MALKFNTMLLTAVVFMLLVFCLALVAPALQYQLSPETRYYEGIKKTQNSGRFDTVIENTTSNLSRRENARTRQAR
jgi:hypothetical protein